MKTQWYFANISDFQLKTNQKGQQTQDERIEIKKLQLLAEFNKMIAKGKVEVPAIWPIKRKNHCVQMQDGRGMELFVCVLESDLNWQPCKEGI